MRDAPSDYDALVDELDELALRRQHELASRDELKSDICALVARAQEHMSIAEIARRLELDRSTLYRVYLNGA